MSYSESITIPGIPNEITVDKCGNVFSRGKMLKGENTKAGYKRVHYSVKGVEHKDLVHRLVAKAFIPNPLELPEVNHKDGNKQNNSINNLEWCTRSENLKHAFDTRLRDYNGERNPMAKLTNAEREEIKRLYVKGKHSEFNSYGLAKKYGVSAGCILNIVKHD